MVKSFRIPNQMASSILTHFTHKTCPKAWLKQKEIPETSVWVNVAFSDEYVCVLRLYGVCKSDILAGLHQSPGDMIDEERAEEG